MYMYLLIWITRLAHAGLWNSALIQSPLPPPPNYPPPPTLVCSSYTSLHASLNNPKTTLSINWCFFHACPISLELLGQAEASPTQVMSIEIFHLCMYISAVRHSVYTCCLFQRYTIFHSRLVPSAREQAVT